MCSSNKQCADCANSTAKLSGLDAVFARSGGGVRPCFINPYTMSCIDTGAYYFCCSECADGQTACQTVKHSGSILPHGIERSAKLSGFDFSFGTGGFGGGSGFNYGSGFNGGNYFGSPTSNGNSPDFQAQLDELVCASLGLSYPCNGGAGIPTNTGGTTPSGGTPNNVPVRTTSGGGDSGLSWFDKLLGGGLTAFGLYNQNQAIQNGVRTNGAGQVLTAGGVPNPAGTLAQTGANIGAGAGGLTQGLFSFMNANPLLTVALVGGLALYLMPSPRKS